MWCVNVRDGADGIREMEERKGKEKGMVIETYLLVLSSSR